MATYISDLLDKCNNTAQEQSSARIPVNQKLTAEEFKRLVNAVLENQAAIVRLEVKVNGGVYIEFADPEILRIIVTKFGDGTNITREQALKATSLAGLGFQDNTTITSFDELQYFTNIKKIESSTFAGSSLQSINLCNITEIDSKAFNNCTSLEFIQLSEHCSYLGDSCFAGCTSLYIEDLNLPELATFGYNAVVGVLIKKISSLGHIATLPNTDAKTPKYGNKSILEEITIPSSVTVIPARSFYQYTALKKVNGLEHVTKIGDEGFRECSALAMDVVLSSCTEIESYVFDQTAITSFIAPVLVNIYAGCCYGCQSLTNVKCASATTIGGNAFGNCSSLTHFDFSKIVSIGSAAFDHSGLAGSLSLPVLTTMTGEYNFANTSIETFIAPSLGGALGDRIFYNCPLLHTVHIGPVTEIGYLAFGNCPKLTTLVVNATTPPTLDVYGIGLPNDSLIYVPDSSVSTYQVTTGWMSHANQILPMSQYTGS